MKYILLIFTLLIGCNKPVNLPNKLCAHWETVSAIYPYSKDPYEYIYIDSKTGLVLGLVEWDYIRSQWNANAPNYYSTLGYYATSKTAKIAVEQYNTKYVNCEGDKTK